jgi:hypothetical protein
MQIADRLCPDLPGLEFCRSHEYDAGNHGERCEQAKKYADGTLHGSGSAALGPTRMSMLIEMVTVSDLRLILLSTARLKASRYKSDNPVRGPRAADSGNAVMETMECSS